MYKCLKCENVEFKSYTLLSRHMIRTHGISRDQFFIDFYLNGIHPLCKCGCNQKTKWSCQLKSFRNFCRGHQSRVHNNWGHNKIAIERSSKTRRQQYKSGDRKVWNDGLTVNDQRVKENVKKCTDAINSNPNELIRRSILMTCNRLNGTIPTLCGRDHSQWKGGSSSINILVRSRVKLYKEWKYPILCRDGFKCIKCGSNNNLHIHHDKELMCEIIKKHILDDEPKTFEMKDAIANAVVDYHINNNVSGITLCGACHNELHPSLNFNC